jgi:hypothetical protein
MEDGTFAQVYKSEVIQNNLDPVWRPFEIPLQRLCNGDMHRPVLFQVFDMDKGGTFELIGAITCSIMSLLEQPTAPLTLQNDALAKKKKKAGIVAVASIEIRKQHSFVEFCTRHSFRVILEIIECLFDVEMVCVCRSRTTCSGRS